MSLAVSHITIVLQGLLPLAVTDAIMATKRVMQEVYLAVYTRPTWEALLVNFIIGEVEIIIIEALVVDLHQFLGMS